MGNPFDRVWQFVTSGNRSKLLGILALVGLLAAIPLSVKVAQEQQQKESNAATAADLIASNFFLTDVNGVPKNNFKLNEAIYPVVTIKNIGSTKLTSPTNVVISQIYANKSSKVAFNTQSDIGMSMRNGMFGTTGENEYGAYPSHAKNTFFHGVKSWKRSTSKAYTARVFLNFDRVALESNYDNNQTTYLYAVGTATVPTPTKSPTATKTPTPKPTAVTTRPPASLTPTIPGGTGGSNACQTEVGTDLMLVIDKSGSMASATSSSDKTPRMDRVKQAADKFINKLITKNKTLSAGAGHKVGLVSFANVSGSDANKVSKLDNPLTENLKSIITNVDKLVIGGGTCMECGVKFANTEIKANGRAGFKKVVILLTDGKPTLKASAQTVVKPDVAEPEILDDVLSGNKASSTVFYTIGVGKDVNETFLRKIADSTGGAYFFAPTANDLDAIYNAIAIKIVKGSINGTVFNDINGNKVKNSNEDGLGGWDITVKNSSNNLSVATATSQGDGTFKIDNICDGSYLVGLNSRAGWKQTVPASTAGYGVSINKGEIFSTALFGVQIIPTITQTPTPTLTPTLTLTPTPTVTLTPTPTVTPTPIPAPTLTFSANPTHVNFNDVSTLTWTSTNTTSCTASGNWSGNKATSGSQSTGGLAQTNTFALSCTGPSGTTTKTVTITVGDAPTSTPTAVPTQTPTPTITPTPLPNHTVLALTLLFNDIGIGGANPNPRPKPCQRDTFSTSSCLSNQNPLHQQRPVRVNVFDTTNKLVGEKDGIVSYDTVAGTFKGTIDMDTLGSGNYYVKVKSDYQLQRLIPGIQAIQAEKVNNLPSAALVGGNANKDSALTILDYTMLIGCYSDSSPAVACDPQKKLATDFNDDGNVNFSDYNLFIRNLSVQNED